MEQGVSDVSTALLGLWQMIVAYLPRIAAAVITLLVGWLAALGLRAVARHLVRRVGRFGGVDRQLEASGIAEVAPKAIASVVFWVVMLLFVAAAAQILNLSALTSGVGQLSRYLPAVLSAIVIVVAGVVLGNLARAAAAGAARSARIAHAEFLGTAARFSVLIIAGVMALEQLGVASGALLVTLALLIGGAIAGAALAFGLGSRVAVSNLLAARRLAENYKPGQMIKVGDIEGRIIAQTTSGMLVDTGEGRALVPARIFEEAISVLIDEEQP